MKLLKLNTIFWKIFLSYWLVMLLIVVATTLTIGLLIDRDHLEFRQQVTDSVQASTAIYIYEAGGVEGFEKWLRARKHRHGRITFLVNDRYEDVLGRPLPSGLLNDIANGRQSVVIDRRHRWNVQKVTSSRGHAYWFVNPVISENNSFRQRFSPMGMPRPFRGLMLLTGLVVTGLISFWLARNLTSPIRQLQIASRQISDGQFSTRVDQKVSKRRDELGELGRDFDRMAGQIEQLLSSQQRILRDVSHELRSPLARLQVALELARKASDGRAANEHARIEKEADRLDELIGQVITLVRLESGAEKITMQNIDFTCLLEGAVADAEFEAKAHSKSVRLNGTGKVRVYANTPLLLSALENILRNAVRYTPEQTEVEVNMTRVDKEGSPFVVISITDQGPGVAERALEHLFEPFYREADARDRSSGGYGLGLAIAERAVRVHGGEITARNVSGGGLEVTVTLPMVALG